MNKTRKNFDYLNVTELEDFLMDNGIVLSPRVEAEHCMEFDELADKYNELRCALQLLLLHDHLTKGQVQAAMELSRSLKRE